MENEKKNQKTEQKWEPYQKVKAIFGDVEGLKINDSKKGTFKFRLYLTESFERTNIDALTLSVRSGNCLKRAGIHTIGELCSRIKCSSDLMKLRNCGEKSRYEIMEQLFLYQLSVMSPERAKLYIKETIEKNLKSDND